MSAANGHVTLTLPDGSERSYASGITGTEIAADIGPGLAKAALAVKIDGALSDLDLPITENAALAIVTMKDEADALDLIRHDAAHIMAMAVQELYPGTQVIIGPSIEYGFYYDFARSEPFTPDDLEKIEVRMKEIVDRDVPTRREVMERDAAVAHFRDMGEIYKAELIKAIPNGEDVRIYHHDEWHDLCRGPHLMSSGKIGKAFKLTKLAGAYWRGDSSNEQLQRIYGTAWRDDKELKVYLQMVEEAEKRDHRRLGREMELFHMQEEAVGMIFWHPHGWTLWQVIEQYMRRRLDDAGYVEVKTPQLVDRRLWEESGHWDKFREHMFVAKVDEYHAREKRTSALKPMNCPCHVQIFNTGIKSYRDLPLRMAEFGSCHRYEPSGALYGIMRVRGFTQDDAHIFCDENDISVETEKFIDLLSSIYADLGFPEFSIKFSDRPETHSGEDAVWDKAETALIEATRATGREFTLNPGEGAFYGPKLEFVLRDAIGRHWQCGTLQVDFVLPERLNAEFVGEDGAKQRPVMLHRAILGSFERFIGILIEQYAGRFPLWLAPKQIVIATIVSEADGFAEKAAEAMRATGLRVDTDFRNEKINYKIREHSHAHVPVIAIIGKREAEQGSMTLRRLGSKEQQTLALDEAISILGKEAAAPDQARALKQ